MNVRSAEKGGARSLPLRFDEQSCGLIDQLGSGNGRDRLGSGAGRRPVVGLSDQADRGSDVGWSSPSRATLIKKRSPS